jgi:hypothetical protein
MSLIDTTYFINDIGVPLSSNTTLNSNFTNAITRYENEILKKLLGYTLWKEFTDAVEAATEESPLAQKWIDLRDGAEFSFEWEGYTVSEKWNGLVNSDLRSLIAYYVYYMYRRDNESQFTGIGESLSISENSKWVSPLNKLVHVYNSMVDLYGKTPNYARAYKCFLNVDDYVHYNTNPSAYNFLLANKDDYTSWVFTPIGKVNSFGI